MSHGGEQSFPTITSNVLGGDLGVLLKFRGSTKPSEMLILPFSQEVYPPLLPVALLHGLGGAGYLKRGVQSSQGAPRMHPLGGCASPEGLDAL